MTHATQNLDPVPVPVPGEDFVFPFGKYQGMTLRAIAEGECDDDAPWQGLRYLEWLAKDGTYTKTADYGDLKAGRLDAGQRRAFQRGIPVLIKSRIDIYGPFAEALVDFVNSPWFQGRLDLAYSPVVEGRPLVLTRGVPLVDLQACTPSDFTIDATYDRSSKRWLGPALWINTTPPWEDPDPTPAEWDLRGFAIDTDDQADLDPDDGWQPSLQEEGPRDWAPRRPPKLTAHRAWSEAIDFLMLLEAVAGPRCRGTQDTPACRVAQAELADLKQRIKARFGDARGAWLRTVPDAVRIAVSQAVCDAGLRVDALARVESVELEVELVKEAVDQEPLLALAHPEGFAALLAYKPAVAAALGVTTPSPKEEELAVA